MKEPLKKRNFMLILITFFCVSFISVGYAALSSTLVVSGDLAYRADADIRVTNITLESANNGAIQLYSPEYTISTVTTGVKLPSSNSSIVYSVTVKNKSVKDKKIKSVIVVNDNNSNIGYKIEDYGIGDRIPAGDTVTFKIVVSYPDGATVGENIIDEMNLGFVFKNYVPSVLMVASNTGNENTAFLNGPINRNQIEKIAFRDTNVAPVDAIDVWDVSANQDGAINAWYYDSDNDGLYEVYIGSEDDEVFANPNSSYLFYYLENLNDISFTNFNPTKATNMNYMFSHCTHITQEMVQDLLNFIPTGVTTEQMFSYCTDLDAISLNVTSVGNEMFYGCNNLIRIAGGSNITSIGNNAFNYTGSGKLTTYVNTNNNVMMNYNWAGDNRIEFFVDADTRPYLLVENSRSSVGEHDTREGAYVTDSNSNEWVWVVVPKTSEVYPTAGLDITDFSDANLTKIENDLKTYTTMIKNKNGHSGTNYSDTYKSSAANGSISSANYTAYKNKFLMNTYKYGGFYVGRYEAGVESARTSSSASLVTPKVQRDLYPYNFVTRANASNQAINVTPDSAKYITTLPYGLQFDLVDMFIYKYADELGSTESERENKILNNSSSWGNYTGTSSYVCLFDIDRGSYCHFTSSSNGAACTWNAVPSDSVVTKTNANYGFILSTGTTDRNKVLNMYDFAGNVAEWTMETSGVILNLGVNICRAGYANSTDSSQYNIAIRDYYAASYTHATIGFRPYLYKVD